MRTSLSTIVLVRCELPVYRVELTLHEATVLKTHTLYCCAFSIDVAKTSILRHTWYLRYRNISSRIPRA